MKSFTDYMKETSEEVSENIIQHQKLYVGDTVDFTHRDKKMSGVITKLLSKYSVEVEYKTQGGSSLRDFVDIRQITKITPKKPR